VKIAFSPYELKGLKTRQGALLRIQFEDNLTGFADCHPWESLGDLPLHLQLDQLQQAQTTPLTARSLHFARLDAEARAKKVSLFDGLTIPPSHFLILDLLPLKQFPQGYRLFKIKLGQNLSDETKKLRTLLNHFDGQVRLDFNARLSRSTFEAFLEEMGQERQKIEFCEDPFPYKPEAWKEVQERYAISLACDHHSEAAIGAPESAAYLVIKPAIQDEKPFLKSSQKLLITSYLDHPLGQATAAYIAATLPSGTPCGLLSHYVYTENPFSRLLSSAGIQFPKLPGTGFGFDELLQQLTWQE
jgi:o-succinylbenzoate synthase